MNPTSSILIIDDSADEILFIKRAFKKARCKNTLVHINSGDKALDYLFRRGPNIDDEPVPRPAIILLDLNMPGTDGREVLRQIKADEELAQIPVVIMTHSEDESDIKACYAAGANSFIPKPVQFDSFIKSIQLLHDYWFELSLLPSDTD